MEGMGFSDLLSTTEEMLITGLMENPIGKTDPSLEMLEFNNIMEPFKAESEEPFCSWLTHGEFHASTTSLGIRQAPIRRYDVVQGSEVTMVPHALNSITGQGGTLGSLLRILTCTPEHEKLDSKVDGETFEVGLSGILSQDAALSSSSIQGVRDKDSIFHTLSPIEVPVSGDLPATKKPIKFGTGGLATETKCVKVSRENSRGESLPALSVGLEFCDGNGQSGHAFTNYSISRKHDQEDAFDNKSTTKGDPTKKRRIERSRKMAEAKERNLISIPSDMQAILKRCENLEKEIRSLKLNLSFMNRKDLEQRKQIEELQKQNEELAEEKEHLLGEREQIISVSRKR